MKNCGKIFNICLIVSIAFLFASCYTPKDYYHKEIKPLYIKATLLSKYKDTPREYPRIIIKGKSEIDTITLINNLELWDYLIKGDSILKDKGSLEFTIIRNGNRAYFDINVSF